MKYFMNLKTRTKLILSFGLICFLFLALIILAYRSIQDIAKSEKMLYSRDITIALALKDFRSNQNVNRVAIMDMMETTNKPEQLVLEESINERSREIDTIIARLSILASDPIFQAQYSELKTNIELYRTTRKEEISLIKEGKLVEVQNLGRSTQKIRFDKIKTLADSMNNKAVNRASEQVEADFHKSRIAIILFIIIGIVAFCFSLIIVFVMNNTIAKPLNEMSLMASRIASGDLSISIIPIGRMDEVGILNIAFVKMVENLRRSISDIIEAVNSLGSSSSEILAATTQVASGSAETAAAISETTTTVEQVRQAAQLSNQKASRVAENAQQVVAVTQLGHKAVDDTINGMHEIQNQMVTSARTIERLSEQSQQIGGIIASVTDVADQSNLLSVNAAIEAAKAGEHGKGFAVVAQEIKSLAQQSKQATIEVRNILNEVQKATSATVMSTEQTIKAVENGVKQSVLAGETIKKLADSSVKAVEAATQIVASSQQQTVGMDQIGLAMQNINHASAENASSMVQAEKAAKNLSDLGQKLKILVNQYKL